MRIAISGTYSSDKTTTSLALAHLTGIPQTHAKTMREILPEALPGKRLEDCTAPDRVQLGMIRPYTGIHPSDDAPAERELSDGERLFDEVMDAVGQVAKRHAKASYDVFVHLPIEFALVADGHRPVSERFRALCDDLLLRTLVELQIPHHVIGGTRTERLTAITTVLDLPHVTTVEAAIAAADADIARMDVSDETARMETAR